MNHTLNRGMTMVIACLLSAGLFTPAHAYEALRKSTELRYLDEARACPGYTLFAAQGITFLIDLRGNVVHTWPGGTNPRLLDNGNLLDATSGDPAGWMELRELDWLGGAVWTYREQRSGYAPHADFVRIYNPKLQAYTTLYLANKSIPHAQAIAAGCDPANGPYDGSQADAVVEVDMSGNVIWEWAFLDHAVQDIDPSKENYVGSGKTIADYPGRIDLNLPGRPVQANWLDCNSLDYNQSLDQIVICSTRGEFYVIDHGGTFLPGEPAASIALAAGPAGDFLYRFGDPARYEQGNPPAISADWTSSTTGHKQIGAAHHVQWIRSGLTGAGHILLVDNGQYLFERTSQSAILEINPFLNSGGADTGQYVNPPDAGYTTVQYPKDTHKHARQISRQVVWSYASLSNQGFFSPDGCSCQRLSNGNTLVCATAEGLLFEVTAAGTLAWEYLCPVTDQGVRRVTSDSYPMTHAVWRAYRYGSDHPGLAGRDLSPLGTIAALATTVYFPWLGYAPGQSTVGIGFSNPDGEPAHADLAAFGLSGEAVGAPGLMELPSEGQAAYQAEGLLGLTEATDGWIRAELSASGVLGFFLVQDFQDGYLAGLDGAPALTATSTDGVLARVRTADGFSTRLSLANPGDAAVTVTITGADGVSTYTGGTFALPARGGLRLDAAGLFAAPFDGAVRLQASGGILACALIRSAGGSLAAINLQPVAQAATTLFAPHVTRLGDLYDTALDLYNPGSTGATATLTPFRADGAPLADPVQVLVPAGRVLTLQGAPLGLPGPDDADGWLRVDGSSPLLGCLTFGHPLDHHYESTLPLPAAGAASIGFAQVANGAVGGAGYFTGVAVVNPSGEPVQFTLQVRFADGTPNGNTVIRTLAPGEKFVRLLAQVEGIGSLASQASGSLWISANAPVLAFELFGDTDGRFLSAVPTQ